MSTRLSKELGLFGLISLSLGAMIGGGIFVLPGLAMAKMGPSVWIAYLAAGALVLPAALAKAELATALPGAGGSYLFIERSAGPLAGTVAGLGTWLVLLLKGAFALVGVSYYMTLVADLPVTGVGMGLLLFIVVLNCLGAKKTARLQIFIVSLCLVTLIVLSTGGLVRGSGDLTPSLPMGLGGLAAAIGFVFISYAGVTSVASVAEEVRRPARDLPLSMLVSLGIMMVVYSVISLSLAGTCDWLDLSVDIRPMATLALATFGRRASVVVALVAILALVSMANAGLMAASRYPMAMARDDLMPVGLRRNSVRFGTPIPSILTTGACMGAIILFVDIEKIVKLASAFKILVFGAECFCLLLLRETKPGWYRPTFRTPLYPYLPAFGLISMIGLIISLGALAMASVAAVGLFGAVWYLAYGRRQSGRKGVLQQVSHREDLLPRKGMAGETKRIPRPVTGSEIIPAAEIIVPLLGREVSPEALVEVASTLAETGERIEVLRLCEVPPQTVLSAALEADDLHARALERRIGIVGENIPVEIGFDTVVTRDVRSHLHACADSGHVRWIVMEWQADRWQGVIVSNPLAWWMAHLPCNLALFRDAGNRHVRRIAATPEPGPHDSIVVREADRLSRQHGSELVFLAVLAEGAPEEEAAAITGYHGDLAAFCESTVKSCILRGDDREGVLIEALVDFDLLVTGARSDRRLQRFFSSPVDGVFRGAPCSVLSLRTPRKQAHRAIEKDMELGERARLEAALADPIVVLDLEIATLSKEAVFNAIALAFVHDDPALGQAEDLEESFWKRERLQNTAVGDGVAFPHATVVAASRTRLGVFAVDESIDYQIAGGAAAGVDLFFATVGPPDDRTTHLRIVSAVAKALLHHDLRKADTPVALRAALVEAAS